MNKAYQSQPTSIRQALKQNAAILIGTLVLSAFCIYKIVQIIDASL